MQVFKPPLTLAAVGVQQAGDRGVSGDAIKATFDGAQVLNCVGGMATIYSETSLNSDLVATEVTLGIIREVRIAIRARLTREVANYSEMIAAFKAGLPEEDEDGAEPEAMEILLRSRAQKPDPEVIEYLGRLKGCVTSKLSEEVGIKEGEQPS